MTYPSICLSFVFNHQYEKNIPKLKRIYNDRFSNIRYLSPFSYWNRDSDIIPIYETSIHFQGYFAQAYAHLPKDFDYYVFCADDLLLNPKINEKNIIKYLNCHNAGYIKYLNPIWEHSFAWHKFSECLSFPDEKNPIPHEQLLPKRENILKMYKKQGIEYRNLALHNFWGVHNKGLSFERLIEGLKYILRYGLKRYSHLPLLEGYSDLIVIPKDNLKLFCHYCGIFAAMNLWVDAAIATSMVLSCEKITQEHENELRGKEFWNPIDASKAISKAEGKIEKLGNIFSDEVSYIHPIKLSKFS